MSSTLPTLGVGRRDARAELAKVAVRKIVEEAPPAFDGESVQELLYPDIGFLGAPTTIAQPIGLAHSIEKFGKARAAIDLERHRW